MAGSCDDQQVPEFFSVFLHDRCTRSLHVSSAFGKRHIESSSNKTRRRATIRRPGTNKEWNVRLVEEDSNEYYFTKGWNSFVNDNCLSDGEFMIFQYHGNSFFTVDILGIHGCLKDSVTEGQSIADVNLVKIEDVNADEEDKKCYGRGRPIVEDALSDAVIAAKFYMKTHCDYPSFRVSITKWKHILHVPLSFANTYMTGKEKRTIKLKVMNKTWSVNMLFYQESASPYLCKLSKGISAFIEDNNIKDRDVCVFELVDLDLLHGAIFPN